MLVSHKMKRIKVLYVNHGSCKGGAFQSLFTLIKHLDNNIIDPVVCNPQRYDGVVSAFKKSNVSVYTCNLQRFAHTTGGYYKLSNVQRFFNWLADYKHAKERFKKIIEIVQPDIVHFNSLTFAPYAIVPKELGIPTIVHVRETVSDGYFGIRKKWLLDHLSSNADIVISVCEYSGNQLGISSNKLRIVYNPILINKFDWRLDKQSSRRELNIPENAITVLFGGGSVPWEKGIEDFLAAMKIVVRKYPNALLLMPSSPRLSKSIKSGNSVKEIVVKYIRGTSDTDKFFDLVMKNGLYDNIQQCDFTDKMELWISSADIASTPHLTPHFSRTLVEAALMKIPTVGYNVGGIQEAISDNKTGFLATYKKHNQLAQFIIQLIENKRMRMEMGNEAYSFAMKRHNPKVSSQKVFKIYQELLEKE